MRIATRLRAREAVPLQTRIDDLKVRFWRDILGMRDSRFQMTSREKARASAGGSAVHTHPRRPGQRPVPRPGQKPR